MIHLRNVVRPQKSACGLDRISMRLPHRTTLNGEHVECWACLREMKEGVNSRTASSWPWSK